MLKPIKSARHTSQIIHFISWVQSNVNFLPGGLLSYVNVIHRNLPPSLFFTFPYFIYFETLQAHHISHMALLPFTPGSVTFRVTLSGNMWELYSLKLRNALLRSNNPKAHIVICWVGCFMPVLLSFIQLHLNTYFRVLVGRKDWYMAETYRLL